MFCRKFFSQIAVRYSLLQLFMINKLFTKLFVPELLKGLFPKHISQRKQPLGQFERNYCAEHSDATRKHPAHR